MACEFLLTMKPAFDYRLGCDPCVVRARHPQGVVALHALPADEYVLKRVVQRVTEVQRAGYVGRGNDDRIRRVRWIGFAMEIALFVPKRVPAFLRFGMLVLRGEISWLEHRGPSKSVRLVFCQLGRGRGERAWRQPPCS